MARVILLVCAAWPFALAQSTNIEIGTVSKPVIEQRLRAFEDTNVKREVRLRELFEEAGCTADRLTEQPVKHAKAPNVICTLAGESEARSIIVGAHFDFVDRGKGVVDNWSGCSLLPSLLESLKSTPRHHSFVFIGFTDEEKGLVGSRFYVHELDKEGRQKIRAMVNMDSLGTSPTKFELDRADKILVRQLELVAANFKLPLQIVNVHRVGRSDSDSFQDARIPAICIHSVTNETWPILHSPRDQMSAMRLDDYYESYLLLRAYLAYLDVTLD
jgi:Iap family predicted aminopeptidase